MILRRPLRWLNAALTAAVIGGALANTLPSHAAPWAGNRHTFASPRFEQVWRSADLAVQQGQASRSWTWGPQPWFDYREFYQQSPDGLRLVQYFDKSRMEINDPANMSGPLAGVTNGLLPVELISGRVKLGEGTGADQNEQRAPAEIPVAGDPAAQNPDAPTYASFRSVATTDNTFRDPNKVGQRVATTFDKNGAIGARPDLANHPGTNIVLYESVTGHNVPRVFDDFRNAGPVPAIYAFGYPITDPYWVVARVGGQDQDVLVQIYERRVLTYTPSNPPAFQVEMGNVGQHYFQWRYPQLGTPWNSAEPRLPIAFATKATGPGGRPEVMLIEGDGSNLRGAVYGQPVTVPFSVFRSWDPARLLVYGDSTFYDGKRQLITFPMTNSIAERFLQSNANDYNPAVSPDGTKVAFASDRDDNVELYLMNLRGGEVQLTATASGCVNQYPAWLPDGSGIVYESNCEDGNFEIYRLMLSYNRDQADDLMVDFPSRSTRLTFNSTDDRFPRIAPDGTTIAFTAMRDRNAEIYLMDSDGDQQMRLTNSAAADEAPTWSPDGSQIAFTSNRDGDYEIFVMNRDGSGQVQLTNNGQDEHWPIWAQ